MSVIRAHNISLLVRTVKCVLLASYLSLGISVIQAETLVKHMKRFTFILSNRNLDSLRSLIDPNRIYVEISPKSGSYLSPLQTLAVIESFFRAQPPISFSYLLIKEEGKTGLAIGSLIVIQNSRNISHKVNFGFQKNNRDHWLLGRISIH